MNAPTPAAQIKRGRKYDQVIEGARQVFLQDGFEGASVDLIARSAGVSKATLYSYFPDKRLLFMEVATAECQRQAAVAFEEIDFADPPEKVLSQAARRMMGFVLSGLGCGVFRIVVAENERFPELGQVFWENGPGRAHAMLVSYIEQAGARGELNVEDPDLAAYQFAELCKAELFPRMVMGLAKEFSQEERDRVAKGAIEMFLARYGA